MMTTVANAPITLHFNLDWATGFTGLTLDTGARSYPLVAHDPQTRAAGQGTNRALGVLGASYAQALTHYTPAVVLPLDVARLLRVTADPLPGQTAALRPLLMTKVYIPAAALRQVRQARLARTGTLTHATLRRHAPGLLTAGWDPRAQLDLAADADLLGDTPLDIARTLAFYHPQLTSRDPQTAAIVMDEHIDTTPDLFAFATLISRLGPATEQGGWARITPSVTQDGQVLVWAPGWEAQGHQPGDPVYHYRLSDAIAGDAEQGPADPAGRSVVNRALQTSQDDDRLRNQLWSVDQGTPNLSRAAPDGLTHTLTGPLAGPPVDSLADSPAHSRAQSPSGPGAAPPHYQFTLNNRTPGYGLRVPKESIAYSDGSDETGRFAIAAGNGYLRTLVAYVQFRNAHGDPIADPVGWTEQMPTALRGAFESPTKKFITELGPVSVILGIPMPTDPTRLNFPWPAEAVSCDLLFGGLGIRDWDGIVDPPGIILTSIFQYGVPLLFMAAGAAITNSGWFKAIVADRELFWASIAAGSFVVGGGLAVGVAVGNTKRVLFTFGNAMAGLLVHQGMEKLATYVMTRLTAAELADSIPFVGWGLRLFNMAVSLTNLTETTVAVMTSPCTYRLEVKRALALEVTISPDPAHGTATQPPIWPELATRYVVRVQYRGGTNYSLSGRLPTALGERTRPLVARFPDLPGGGLIEVTVGLYSDNDWLAGRWTSPWTPALLAPGESVLRITGAIGEQLAPLSAGTQYRYDQKLIYDERAQTHTWQRGHQPTAVITALDGGATGHRLGALVDLTINDEAYMLGYCWQASGQNLPLCGTSDPTQGQVYAFQNISTLARPDAALKFPRCGFAAQPYLVYDQFGAGQVSPNNFFVDPRGEHFHLRRVVLDDSTPFDLQPGQSYGYFTQPHLDAVVIHPAGFAIGVNWQTCKMEMIQIPEASLPDAQAQPASLVAGRGVRQGLLLGPRALAVAADGRVLVLETINRRIQSFDLHGNTSASFLGDPITTLGRAATAADLDAGLVTLPLRDAFATGGARLSPHWRVVDGARQLDLVEDDAGSLRVTCNGADPANEWLIGADLDAPYRVLAGADGLRVGPPDAPPFRLDGAARATLDLGVVDAPIVAAFAAHGIDLSPQAPVLGNPLLLPGSLMAELARGAVPAALTTALQTRDVTLSPAARVQSVVTVRVENAGALWTLEDEDADQSYRIAAHPTDGTRLQAAYYNPFMPLRPSAAGVHETYLDLATEMKGYLYVLGYDGDGTQVSDYWLDLYDPQGRWLVRTPDTALDPAATGVNAGKLAVDLWRTLFTLNFESFQGPGGRTEPSIGRWLPVPPRGADR